LPGEPRFERGQQPPNLWSWCAGGFFPAISIYLQWAVRQGPASAVQRQRPETLSPAAIRAERGWLRRLSRALLQDSDAAEDAVQETWLASLAHPPKKGGSLGDASPDPLPRRPPRHSGLVPQPGLDGSADERASLKRALQERMREAADRIKACVRRWATLDPALGEGVHLTIQLDERGLQDVWLEDRSDVPSGSLGWLSEAVYQTDWSGITTSPVRTMFTVRVQSKDGGPPP
jgi:hypothetical protein